MKLTNLLAAVSVLGLVSYVFAADEPTSKPKHHDGVMGKLVKVDGTDIVLSVKHRGDTEAKEVTVKTDDKTVVTLDKQEAKLADLKADMWVYATPAEGVATKVMASTKRPERHKPDAPKTDETK